MRIAAISDIHVRPDGSDTALLQEIRSRVEEIAPDVFVIAGDISDHSRVLSESLALLYIDDIPCLYVAGNHDIWFEDETGLSSLKKYSHLIGEICQRNGFIHLPDQSYLEGDLAFVGSIGWSDYTFRRTDLEIPEEQYETKEHKGAIWYDVFNIDWEFTDREATSLFNRKLEYDLSILPDEVTRVVYVSHHLPFRELTVYKDRLPWDFFSAYMGSTKTGEILLDDERVILSIAGHSHIRNRIEKEHLTAITVPLGYGRPQDNDFTKLAKDAVAEVLVHGRTVETPQFVEGDICEGLPYVR
ncbi:hypothetical protein EU520_00705 [Candidatus Thorarchaeota archaeon]|nr:MAG: hypothetical protein EU520_00705 [Candidatus Thorarchaeota archaeon]